MKIGKHKKTLVAIVFELEEELRLLERFFHSKKAKEQYPDENKRWAVIVPKKYKTATMRHNSVGFAMRWRMHLIETIVAPFENLGRDQELSGRISKILGGPFSNSA